MGHDRDARRAAFGAHSLARRRGPGAAVSLRCARSRAILGDAGWALDPGEAYDEGARRELREETGLDLDCGPEVGRRLAEFVTLEGVPVVADERYFLVRTDTGMIETAGHTDLERRVMRGWRWFTRAELAAHEEPVFPDDLLDMLGRIENGE